MQTLPDAAAESPPFSTPLPSGDDQLLSPSTSNTPSDVDPLIAQTAKRLADVINDFKRELDKRDGVWAYTHGALEITLKGNIHQSYEVRIIPDEDGDEYPITVQASLKKEKSTASGGAGSTMNPNNTNPSSSSTSLYQPVRRDSDAELERDILPRRKRKLDEGINDGASKKRPRTDEDDDEDIMPLISTDGMEDLLTKLRDDIQEDTSECVNHVQKLLRRFKEEWHEKSKWDYEQLSGLRGKGDSRNSVERTSAPDGFPSPTFDRGDESGSLHDFIRREAKLLSSQIRWVEECRRVASDAHDKREETWRTSSAGFHDRNRQDRENFQQRILGETTRQGQMLNQILNEVKGLAHVTMSLKWETPDQLTTHPVYPPPPSVPAFPTQPAPSTGRSGVSRTSTGGTRH
ncbi:hypothetical protein GQ43DRAFT_33461 [Delitschia confertaspora ATCC 74209]|uniref:Uncharacterized protein n=1 Tax=Delitschia confertaspora ATCC 74209 TaxID=1513339 RepID=A0A9P4MQ84_9PLEO|nr:hypothetical protein GQ43DRAFT_33461 [Delitschia confertaspora ATCC 74209]